MKYYSTTNKNKRITFKEAVLKGIDYDGGLFMPEYIPEMSKEYFNEYKIHSFKNIAFSVLKNFIDDEIPLADFEDIVDNIFTFKSPLVKLDDNINLLELFHGPTLAFKDFGARFTAAVTEYFNKQENRRLFILVATSGDTGSAVANGFFNKKGIDVVVLYPKGKISVLQEKQITTLGGNVKALEIEGTFDDCQKLVKTAFNDNDLTDKIRLSSANSINIARLLPQMIYYFDAYFNLGDKSKKIVYTVPSGNLGNLTAGLLAKKMGLPVFNFIGAVNKNDVFESYINSGKFMAKQSLQSYSNAMDVGNPSNITRIFDLFNNNYDLIKSLIKSISINDSEILDSIIEVYEKYKYKIDPHGAVGYWATKKLMKNFSEDTEFIILETAHPAKFFETVESVIPEKIKMPDRLIKCMDKEKRAIKLSAEYIEFKDYLLNIEK